MTHFKDSQKKVYDALVQKAYLFTVEKAAEEHCHCSAPSCLINV
jgi:hypothetical protein